MIDWKSSRNVLSPLPPSSQIGDQPYAGSHLTVSLFLPFSDTRAKRTEGLDQQTIAVPPLLLLFFFPSFRTAGDIIQDKFFPSNSLPPTVVIFPPFPLLPPPFCSNRDFRKLVPPSSLFPLGSTSTIRMGRTLNRPDDPFPPPSFLFSHLPQRFIYPGSAPPPLFPPLRKVEKQVTDALPFSFFPLPSLSQQCKRFQPWSFFFSLLIARKKDPSEEGVPSPLSPPPPPLSDSGFLTLPSPWAPSPFRRTILKSPLPISYIMS